MIKHAVGTAICLLCAAVSWGSDPPEAAPHPITVTIIWDASADGGRHWPDYHSICRQSGSSLKPGDRLEVISAHAGKPKLRVSQILKAGDSQELASIYSLLKDIRCPFLFNAHVEKAVAMATTRLNAARRTDGDRPAMMIILTTGDLNSREIRAIRNAGQQFSQWGWKLYVVGTSRSARGLLIAAHQGQFEWSALSNAAPSAWIDQLRPSAEEDESDEPIQVQEADPVPDQAPAPHRSTLPEGIGMPTGEPIEQAPPSKPISVEITIKNSDDRVPEPPAVEPEPQTPEVEPEPVQPPAKPQPQPERIEEPNMPVQSTRTASGRSLWHPMRPWLWLAIAATAGLAALVCLLIEDGRQATGWRTKATAGLKDAAKDDGTLVATLNGQTHHLGRYTQLRTINIGSGTRNTIRVCDKAVSDRHVQVYRKGSRLMVRNLGAKPITVNNLPLAPKDKKLLVLPAVLGLSETATLKLSLVKPKEKVSAGRSENHGQSDSQKAHQNLHQHPAGLNA